VTTAEDFRADDYQHSIFFSDRFKSVTGGDKFRPKHSAAYYRFVLLNRYKQHFRSALLLAAEWIERMAVRQDVVVVLIGIEAALAFRHSISKEGFRGISIFFHPISILMVCLQFNEIMSISLFMNRNCSCD